MKKVLVTGATGYIGSHTCLSLLRAGFDVVAIDNLCNSSYESLKRVQDLANKELIFIEGDIRNQDFLNNIFLKYDIDSVIHFAALKSIGESTQKPLIYYSSNVSGTLTLCESMNKFNIKKLVYSSSCTVYGNPIKVPIDEGEKLSNPTNPYGRSKLIIEQALSDIFYSDDSWNIAILRYFNPVGADSSGLIGESPYGTPNNLVPYITQVAIGNIEKLEIFGRDYNTPDGTGIRDYIHVTDLAEGHIAALKAMENIKGLNIWNLGTGKGHSVLEVIKAFERTSGIQIPFEFKDRRAGDIDMIYADPSKAISDLEWSANKDLNLMLADAWNWQRKNPNGY